MFVVPILKFCKGLKLSYLSYVSLPYVKFYLYCKRNILLVW